MIKKISVAVEKEAGKFALKFSFDGKAAPVKHYTTMAMAAGYADEYARQLGKQIRWDLGSKAMATWAIKRTGSFDANGLTPR
jgi:hypothetical protein